jgi:hypothetical protein
MLAEIFLLRLEAILRASQQAGEGSRFVPLAPELRLAFAKGEQAAKAKTAETGRS